MTKRKHEMKYKWRETYRGAVDADVAGAELGRIKRTYGELTAQAVVDESRPEEAPLHPVFEWDDAVAAEKYRRSQAQTVIRALVVVETPEAPEHRKYVLVRSEQNKSAYEDIETVVQDADLFADAVRRLEVEVQAAKRSVAELEAIASANSEEPERMARIALAAKALEAASAAVAGLH